MKPTGLPLGVVVQPMADVVEGDAELPVIPTETEGPFRCPKCGAYINPGFHFVEGGSQIVCNICGHVHPTAKTPYEYSQDKQAFTELSYGAYDFEVSGRYIYQAPR